MKKRLFLVFALFLAFLRLSAQVNVSGSTGANGTYANLRLAFNSINAWTNQSGNNIVITISSSITDNFTATLNQSSVGVWSSLIIYPTTSGVTLSGSIAGPMIDLNGADHVTIDGRVNATGTNKDLVITNTSTSNVDGTSTVRFINNATYNTVQYCTIKGAELNTNSGIVFFSGSSTSAGNTDNSITYCNITSNAGGRPINAIFSYGAVLGYNSRNSVTNNFIYDFLNPGISSNGISISFWNDTWMISDNSFYETTAFTTTSETSYNIIYAFPGISKLVISNNFIGGSAPFCSGFWSKTGDNNHFYAIYLLANTGTGNESNIQNNTIKNISWSNSSNAIFNVITVMAGNVNIGTETGNTIGDPTTTGSIVFTSGASGGQFNGISISSTGIINIQNNILAGITTANSAASPGATNFTGIYNSGSSTISISNNTIGSSSISNSIQANSVCSGASTGQSVFGIYKLGTGTLTCNNNLISHLNNSSTYNSTTDRIQGIRIETGISTVSGNTVKDLSISSGTGTTNNASAIGIMISASTYRHNVIQNNIYNIKNTNTGSSNTIVYGLYFFCSNSSTVELNFVHSLENSSNSTNAIIGGMSTFGGTCTYKNNIISMSFASFGAQMFGFYNASSNTVSIYFNTISLSGTPANGATTDVAFITASTNSRNIRNNIFSNTRGGGGIHRAVQISSTSSLTVGYNCYIGALSGITLNTAPDNNSTTSSPSFINEGGVHAIDYKPLANNLYGITISGITSDFEGTLRRSIPTMGAIESDDQYLFVDIYKAGVLQERFPSLNRAFLSINNGIHTGSLEIRINDNSTELSSAVLNASGVGSANYSDILIFPTVSGITISCNFPLPLIDLNGADNVIIDGRVNTSGTIPDLVITNSNTSNTSGTSALRFRNSAQNNSVRYCTIKGSGRSTSSGVIYFFTAGTGTGNNNTMIHHCNITSDAAGRPVNLIYSVGSGVGIENINNVISENMVYDFFNPNSTSYGIYLTAYNKYWTISGNSFYETTEFSPLNGPSYYFINIIHPSCSNIVISENKIGGNAPDAIGLYRKTGYNNPLSIFRLNVASGVGLESSIENNIIKNFSWANTTIGTFNCINVSSGDVNIAGNSIGDSDSESSIYYSAGSSGGNFYAFNISSAGNVNIESNTVAGITTDNSTGIPTDINFFGIYKTGTGSSEISNNTIGSESVANSINASSVCSVSSNQSVCGIMNIGSGSVNIENNLICQMKNASTAIFGTPRIQGIYLGAGSSSVIGNRIADLTIACGFSSLNNASAVGIMVNAPAYNHTVSQNTVYNIKNTYLGNETTHVYGLFINVSTGTNLIERNFIHSLENASVNSLSLLSGIYAYEGTTTYQNNIVSLKDETNGAQLYGFFNSGGVSDIYFNTIALSGSSSSGSTDDAAFFSNAENIRNIRNNIFSNIGGGSGNHYAANISYTTDLTIGYNDYFGALLGISLNTAPDNNSLDLDPLFEIPGGLQASNYFPSVILPGIDGTGISGDYYDQIRNIPPTMGALELVFNNWTGTLSTEWNNNGNWSTGFIPESNTCVKIPDVSMESNRFPSIECSAVCKIALIDSDAKVEIAPDYSLTVYGTLYNNSGTSGLCVHSDANGMGSLIFSNPDVDGTFENYLTGTQWHYISSPITEAPISMFNTNNFYRWDASLEWEGVPDYNPWIQHYSDLTEAQGYAYYYYQTTLNYEGVLNQGEFPVTLYKSVSGTEEYQGWNLIGNPYTSALNWETLVNDASVFDNEEVEGAVYLFDDVDQTGLQANYRYYVPAFPNHTGGVYGIGTADASQYIPAGQGFFVKAITNGASITFKNAYREHNTQNYYKSDDLSDVIRIAIVNDQYNDELVFRYANDATANFDAFYDARKLFPNNSEFPMLYALNHDLNEKMAINSISITKGLYPLGIKCITGEYSLSVLSNSFSKIPVFLYDAYTKNHIAFSDSGTYSYSTNTGTCDDRFFLRFGTNSSPIVSGSIDDITIFTGNPLDIEINRNLFFDDDLNDILSLDVLTADNDPLPVWMTFSFDHLMGVPDHFDIGRYALKVVATDLWGASVEAFFTITVVENPLSESYIKPEMIRVIPNPGSGIVKLIVDSPERYTYEITDGMGRIIYTGSSVMKESSLNLTGLSFGVYFIKVNFGNHQYATEKILIQ